jgi:hypothetical protein
MEIVLHNNELTPGPNLPVEAVMSEQVDQQAGTTSTSMAGKIIVGVMAVALVFALFSAYQLNRRLQALETKQKTSEEQISRRIASTESNLKASTETLAERVGMTQKDLEERAAALQRQQRVAESRLSEEQRRQKEALSGELTGVKTEVGGVKTDVATTRTELEATKAKLERAIGDLGIQSGLIATTREDLEVLRHRGDRNYYEFTLNKGGSPTPVSTISLVLKKADRKKGKYTLNVTADDRTIEKKDRNMNEPVQFYTGRDRMLYELVVFSVEKDKVAGYLSTPKSAPQPVTR